MLLQLTRITRYDTRSAAARPQCTYTAGVDPMLVQCWATVEDGDLELTRHWVNVSSFLGYYVGAQCEM